MLKLTGKWLGTKDNPIFEIDFEGEIKCWNCKSVIFDKDKVYICEIDRTIFCKCHQERNTSSCPNTLMKDDHLDIYCTFMRKRKQQGDGVGTNEVNFG